MKTGLVDLDEIIKLDEPKLIVLSSVQDIGEFALSLSITNNIALEQNIPSMIFSLSLDKDKIYNKILSSESLVNAEKLSIIMAENSDECGDYLERIVKGYKELLEKHIYVDDTKYTTIEDIEAKCRCMKQMRNIKFVMIDYMQLIDGKEEEIIERLKKLSEELQITILVNSLLTEEINKRKDPVPKLEDIKNKSILEFADIILLFYRDDYYNKDSEKKNIVEVIVAKNNGGICNSAEFLILDNCKRVVGFERYRE